MEKNQKNLTLKKNNIFNLKMKTIHYLPAITIFGFILIFMVVSLFLNFKANYSLPTNVMINSNNSFYLRNPWKIENPNDDYIIKLIPQANILVIHDIDIQTWIKFTKKDNQQKEYGDGIVFGNMLPGEDNRLIRLYYYKPDANWVLEYQRGTKSQYFPLVHFPIKENVLSIPILIKIRKDGKIVTINFPDDSAKPTQLQFEESLYDITNNMLMGVYLTRNTDAIVEIFNAIQ